MRRNADVKWIFIAIGILGFVFIKASEPKKTVWLTSLDLSKMSQDWDRPTVGVSYTKKPLSISKQTFKNGVGTRVKSCLWIHLAKGSEAFVGYVGADDDTTYQSSFGKERFKIIGDGTLLWESDSVAYGESPRLVDVNVKGVDTLILEVINIGRKDSKLQLDWADARFIVSGHLPEAIAPPREAEIILTPPAALAPHINGPKVYGCRPKNPFLYRIPATGARPMRFHAEHLPRRLHLDTLTGIITGIIVDSGNFQVTLHAANQHGADSKRFTIRSGHILALTPTMGWNDWYAYYNRITSQRMREAADLLIRTGMADLGYQYVNIDDCWMNKISEKPKSSADPLLRDRRGHILSNADFTDMKGLTDYIHSRGLKAGLYASPGPETCGGYAGSYQHEADDAKQFADWGFDFLKYDWCSYGNTLGRKHPTAEMYRKPYQLMGSLLKAQKRDIVFNLCQYGMDQVWKWGFAAGGSSWRTGDDLGFGLHGLFKVAYRNMDYAEYAKPGAWNDPDYIQIGYVGNAYQNGLPVHTDLTPNEQYAFMSMWCLLAAPLIYSGDLTRLDQFTLNVLCNSEVIDIDQDALGKSARAIRKTEESFLMVKDLEDGSKAIGLCNSGELPLNMTVDWNDIGWQGKWPVRDVWRQRDLGVYAEKFNVTVPRHAVVLVRVGNAHQSD